MEQHTCRHCKSQIYRNWVMEWRHSNGETRCLGLTSAEPEDNRNEDDLAIIKRSLQRFEQNNLSNDPWPAVMRLVITLADGFHS